jgi:hypothetical protein
VPRSDHLPVILEAVEVSGVSTSSTAVSGVRASVASTWGLGLAGCLWSAAAPRIAAAASGVTAGISASTTSIGISTGIAASAASIRIAPSVSSSTASIGVTTGIPASAARVGVSAAGVGIAARVSAPTGIRIPAPIATTAAGIRVASGVAAGICRTDVRRSSTATAATLGINVRGHPARNKRKRADKRRQERQSAAHSSRCPYQ